MSKYGRLFTEEDAFQLVWEALGGSMAGVTHDRARGSFARALRDLDACDREYGLTFPADEPLFLLRGQDKAAPTAIRDNHPPGYTRDYFTAAHEAGADLPHLDAIKAAAVEMREWQRANPDRVKAPD